MVLNTNMHFKKMLSQWGDVLTDPTPVPTEFLLLEYHAYKALLTMKSNKAPGPDLVSSRIWKDFALKLAPVVSHLYNSSMEEGCVPIILKESIVTPTPKGCIFLCIEIFGISLQALIRLHDAWRTYG
ncbi:uncharacterized protein [Montipora foliosa]|uniref:uncharacterized protein n=1 Tax=Montipora foliosa TaxID=591990 RepID=UPI0035F2191E